MSWAEPQPALCGDTSPGAACFGSVSLSGASKSLVLVTYPQMARGFSAVKAKVVSEGQRGFGDVR